MIRTSAEAAGRGQSAGRCSFGAEERGGMPAARQRLWLAVLRQPDKRSSHFLAGYCNDSERCGGLGWRSALADGKRGAPGPGCWLVPYCLCSDSDRQTKSSGRRLKASLRFCVGKWARTASVKLSTRSVPLVCAATDCLHEGFYLPDCWITGS